MNSYGLFQPPSRTRSTSPKSRESELYSEYLGGTGRQSRQHLFGQSPFGQSPKNRPGSLSGAKSTPSLWGSGGRNAQSARRSQPLKRSSSYAGQRSGKQTPQGTPQHSRTSTNYNRPWLQKSVRPDGTLIDKTETRRTKETANWWNREAERMAREISKLKKHRDELVEEFAQAEKAVRQCNYELGLARAAHDRQKEQAEAAADRRTELEQEVMRLKQEKKDSKNEARLKKDEAEHLRDKAEDLEAQIEEVKRQQAEKAEKMARRAAAEERKRMSAAASPDAIRPGSATADAPAESAADAWSHPTIHASAGALARRSSARSSLTVPKAGPKRASLSQSPKRASISRSSLR